MNSSPTVQTLHGTLRGTTVFSSGEPIHFFGNIPYAQAPFGHNRFRAPQSIAPWVGVREATAFGPAAPQAPRVADEAHTFVGGEACLTLNIWSANSSAANQSPRPVFVYLPGGGFMRGNAGDPIYDGASFARNGVVFVSFNYRIGMDGFMLFDEAQADANEHIVAANRGLLDQLAAIEWVQNNISAFGGDSSHITLGGVSAGAGSIVHLLGAPSLQGKIKGAILQSPSITAHSLDEARASRAAIAALLGCAPTRIALENQPLHRVVRVVARLLAEYDLRRRYGMSPKHFFPLRPVVDDQIVHADCLAHLRACWTAPNAQPPRILVGANEDEMNFYLVPNGEIDQVDWSRVQSFAQAVGLPESAYQPNGHPGKRLAALQGAHYYQNPAHNLAALSDACGAESWHYRFGWKSPQHGGKMGAAHAMEVPFAFNRLGTERADEMTGRDAPQALADAMHTAWAAFARGESPPDWTRGETKRFA
jgi:para-nitrobenzyl esterase